MLLLLNYSCILSNLVELVLIEFNYKPPGIER